MENIAFVSTLKALISLLTELTPAKTPIAEDKSPSTACLPIRQAISSPSFIWPSFGACGKRFAVR
ncbi:MAG: hypothetical protein A2Y00_01680 [Omnitrophica WOR_2 bacterium GWF2_43_52]|nr:MAG: hypothetical protein A2062_06650 [Omnitrophica WOR_2 bacterium GWA2_44_7]OGX20067.1 MAG: hypothetical protein A2Y00_01680 [Omnitrophica WOR_2 bacterium GWF2_43_52]OGX55256.1 MAG: hypothetical protein A2460_05100 [Omnitrophica WOR_2 bacterium RIFOXYC2_FULL_43_9]